MTERKDQPVLEVLNLSAVFANHNGGLHVLESITFDVKPQEFLCVLGPSGSGKSTLLRIMAGLLPPTQGTVTFNGKPIMGPRKEIGIVFQNANLMPWRTVLENIMLPLELEGVPKKKSIQSAREMVSLVGLQGFDDTMPRDLSGGMAQRVAIGRALIYDPQVLLLDEPFGALDALTRERMGVELLRIWQAKRKTVIMVTHSISEALFLADRVIVLSHRPGKLKIDIDVTLSRPREENMRYTSGFGKLAKKVRAAIEL